MSADGADGLLDFAEADEKTGFRLDRLELLNWGTFDRRVWKLEAGGANTLLTGDIGSGKSTLVDAVSTLLVPPQRLAYNKAAGAGARERTLRSYVLGYYKSERGESEVSSKAVALRDQNAYAVILGSFRNEGYGQYCTLAQVFWIRDQQGQPARFYVMANRSLDIAGDFSGFGPDIGELRKRLRLSEGVELFDSFQAYAAAFRRVFGIDNEQALELFNQTVSMKSVGNLTDFVREHMLEPFEGEERIQALIHHFDDLDRAHAAVLKAKAQLAALAPIVEDCAAFDDQSAEREGLRLAREALASWFAQRKVELLDKRLAKLDAELLRLSARVASGEESLSRLRADRDEVKEAIATNGGDRIERLASEIRSAAEERDRRRARLERYRGPAAELGLPVPKDSDDFARNRSRLAVLAEELAGAEAGLQNERTEREVAFRAAREERDGIVRELESLRARRNNIPEAQIAIRARLCEALDIRPDRLPFAGELLRVKEGEAEWEGAAERLLHGFALSLVVPDDCYGTVSTWVDENQLRGRLVYFRARRPGTGPGTGPGSGPEQGRESGPQSEPHPDSLVRKLEIKRGDPLEDWLARELLRRFDYACCQTLEQFRRERQALTRRGQIKGSGDRHEKDDRGRLDDRSRYVLGWTNEAKIKALELEVRSLEETIAAAGAAIGEIQRRQTELRDRLDAVGRLSDITEWLDLDWGSLSLRVAALEAEKAELESSADRLKALAARLAGLETEIAAVEERLKEARNDHTTAEVKRGQARESRTVASEIAERKPEAREASYARIETLAGEAKILENLSVESCENRESELRGVLQALLDAADKKVSRLREKIVSAMQTYRTTWPLETREVDANVESASAWRAMLEQLRADDLPRFERAFKELLNENTIREVANFQSQLGRERQVIRERIEHINKSLTQIDYNPGRYIVLELRASPDGEIQDFIADLRACTEGSLTGSAEEQYSEAKFLQVKRIIERFRGREGQSEADRRWTAKVSDVRQYFVFSASERWKEDDTEYEHYTDSGGKSGGQKEKLAYTVLAASLAYQFGLEWGAVKSRSFRFVMIDEAFGRGSDESTRFGLELFKKMNLQLLVITPLQKIHIIEPYVASVGFVYNEDGRDSKLRNLSIAEYRAERDRLRAEAR
ncbi:MAG: ATP-binding protein [Rectinemataceae bacterium]